jgi:DNA-binding IscR family transcriptional regulator
VLQALVREGILKGVRGPHGGYALAKDHRRISAEDILRAASRAGDDEIPLPISGLVNDVVRPALADAERSFAAALRRISVEDLARAAEKQK